DHVRVARHVGSYIVVISTHLNAVEVSYIVRDCGEKMLFISEKTEAQANKLDTPAKYMVDERPGRVSLQSLVAAYLAGKPAYVDLSERPAGRDLLYSSGTTGSPK